MWDQLQVQETMDFHLDSMAEETCQIYSQSQEDKAKVAAMDLQLQELISSMEERGRTVGTDLEEVNSHFDCHRVEID